MTFFSHDVCQRLLSRCKDYDFLPKLVKLEDVTEVKDCVESMSGKLHGDFSVSSAVTALLHKL